MNVRFWGVRGSFPTPGEHTRRWGGNTSCLEVRRAGLPPLVLDCGTGARALGEHLGREGVGRVEVLFTHLHMDHLFGFPFFAPLFAPHWGIRVTVPALSDEDARDRIGRYLSGEFHPLRLRDLPAEVTFHGIRPGATFDLGGWSVCGCSLNHPGGSVGYRVEADGLSLCYLTDTAPFARPGEGVAAKLSPTVSEQRVLELIRGADVVVYDTMFTLDEYLERMSWGHSYPEYALALCEAAGVGELVLFHHSPEATDEELDRQEEAWAACEGPVRVTMAKEGRSVDCAASRVLSRGRAAVNAEG